MWKNKTHLTDDPLSIIFKFLCNSKYFRLAAVLYIILSQTMCAVGLYIIYYNRDWNTLWRELPSFVVLEMVIECMVFYLVYFKFYYQLQSLMFEHCWSLDSAGPNVNTKILNDTKYVKLSLLIVIVMCLVGSILYLPIIKIEPGSYLYLLAFEKYMGEYSVCANMLVLFFIPVITFSPSFPTIRITYTTTHLRYQFYLLNEHLKRISEGCCVEDSDYQNVMYNRLKVCILHHIRIKRLIKILNTDLKFLILLIPITSIAAFVAAAYFINAGIDPNSNIRMYILLVIWFTSLTTMSVHCELLIQESDKLPYNAYCCPWINWNKRNKMALLMLLMVSRRPEKVSGFIICVDYPSLLKIFKMTYSILTVFLQMNK